MIEIFDFEQGSPQWFAARMGIPTASEFSTVLAKGKSGGDSKTRATYMRKLAGEILTGEPMESYTNAHLERGKVMEPEARELYGFVHDCEPRLVGFIRNGNTGCSPDSLIGEEGMAEFKSAMPHILIDLIERNEFPPEHYAQCQGGLWIAEREWIDLVVYWPKLPLFVRRVGRDESYIRNLESAVGVFNDELASLVKKIRSYQPISISSRAAVTPRPSPPTAVERPAPATRFPAGAVPGEGA